MLHDSNLFYNSVPRHPSTNGCMVNYKQRRQEAISAWNAPKCKLHRDQRANATATNAPICKPRNARPRTQHFSATLFSTALYKTLPQHFATTLLHTSVQLFSTANTSLQHSTPQNHRDTTTAQNHHQEAKHQHATKSPPQKQNITTPQNHHYTRKTPSRTTKTSPHDEITKEHHSTKSSPQPTLKLPKNAKEFSTHSGSTLEKREPFAFGKHFLANLKANVEIPKSYWRFFYNIDVDVITIKAI